MIFSKNSLISIWKMSKYQNCKLPLLWWFLTKLDSLITFYSCITLISSKSVIDMSQFSFPRESSLNLVKRLQQHLILIYNLDMLT